MSLKSKLKQYLQLNGSLTLNELDTLCRREGYKMSNAERRLRELTSEIGLTHVMKNGAIIRYEMSLAEKMVYEIWTSSLPKESKQLKLKI